MIHQTIIEDPRDLQVIWDAEDDRARFKALRAVVRNRPEGEPHPLVGGCIVLAIFALATMALVAFGGAHP